jgi:hypothetical protein
MAAIFINRSGQNEQSLETTDDGRQVELKIYNIFDRDHFLNTAYTFVHISSNIIIRSLYIWVSHTSENVGSWPSPFYKS